VPQTARDPAGRQQEQAHFQARVTSGEHQRNTIKSALKCKAKFRGDGRRVAKFDAIIRYHAKALPVTERKILAPRPRPVVVHAIKIRAHRSPRVASVSATASADSSGGDDGPSTDPDPPDRPPEHFAAFLGREESCARRGFWPIRAPARSVPPPWPGSPPARRSH
jgi:hypothetical protein